jgi:uncharacterized protein YqgC (DUF456 family)
VEKKRRMALIYYALLILALATGWFITMLGLPGLWLMALSLALYGVATGWDIYVGWQSVAGLFALAMLAELLELLAGARGSKAAGGRKRGIFGAIVGAFIGGIVGTPLMPVIGTLVGACAGAFVGAAALEFSDKGSQHALRVGIGAAKGRFWGTLAKLSVGVVMFAVAAWAAAT